MEADKERDWAGHAEQPWANIILRLLGEHLSIKPKVINLYRFVWELPGFSLESQSQIPGNLSDLGEQGWLVPLQVSPTLITFLENSTFVEEL